jgi:AsmA family protein
VTYREVAAAATTTLAIERLAMAAKGPQAVMDIEFRGKAGSVALALEGTLGSLDALRQRRWPYPVQVRGTLDGRPAAIAAKVTAADGAFRFDELEVTYGANTVRGVATAMTGGPRPRIEFTLAAAALAVADLPAMAPAAPMPATAKDAVTAASAKARGPATAAAVPARAWVFGTDPVRFTLPESYDLGGDLAIEQLTLAGGRRVERVRARIALRDGHAEVSGLEGAVFGGIARGHLTVDPGRDERARIALRLDAKGLDLGPLLAAMDVKRDVRGGKTDVTADILMHGASPRQWASTVSGNVTAIVGPATIVNGKIDKASAFNRLAEVVNPFRNVDATTEVRCAVIRLPFTGGIAHVDHGIAMETAKVGVAASGTIDLRDETLDLALRPRARAAISGQLVQFVGQVRLRGPLAAPAVAIDAKGSLETVARVGAAYATGGLSVLGEAMLGHGAAGGECDTALGRTAAAAGVPAHPNPRR